MNPFARSKPFLLDEWSAGLHLSFCVVNFDWIICMFKKIIELTCRSMSSSLRLLLNAVVILPSWLQPEHTHPGQTWNMTTFFKLPLSIRLLPSSITLVQLIWFILNFLIHFHCYQTAFYFEIRAVLDLFWRFPNSGCVWLNKVDSLTQHMIVHISDHIDKTSWGKAGNYSRWERD